MGGTTPSQARRQRPLQSVPSPLPQISPREASPALVSPWRCWPRQSQTRPLRMPHPAPTPMPLQLQQRSDPRNGGKGSCRQVASVTGSCLPRQRRAALRRARPQLKPGVLPCRYLGLWQGEVVRGQGRLSPGTNPANCACRSCQTAPGTRPDGSAGAARWEGAGSEHEAPSPACTPGPACTPQLLLTLPSDVQLPQGRVPQFPLAERCRLLHSGP